MAIAKWTRETFAQVCAGVRSASDFDIVVCYLTDMPLGQDERPRLNQMLHFARQGKPVYVSRDVPDELVKEFVAKARMRC